MVKMNKWLKFREDFQKKNGEISSQNRIVPNYSNGYLKIILLK